MDLLNPNKHAQIIEQFLDTHPKKVLIFDFDQTLCHLHLPWDILVRKMQDYLKKVDKNLFKQLKPHHPTQFVIDRFVDKYGDEIWQYDRENSEMFERTELRAAPCNHALLEWIRAQTHRYSMYVWSSNISHTIAGILAKEGYEGLFQDIIGKDKVRLTKPAPDGFKVIFPQAQEIIPGLEKGDCLMIGNNPLDDRGAARNAGIDFVRVQYSEREIS